MPRSRISNWHYVYVLQSLRDGGWYIGYTIDLAKRLQQHNAKTYAELHPIISFFFTTPS